MSTFNTSEIRPIADRIEAALILAKSATGILEKRDDTNMNTAASVLLEAGITLLGQPTERAYILTDEHHNALFDALVTCKLALKLILRDEASDIDGTVHSVVQLVYDALEAAEERIDLTPMSHAGMVLELGRRSPKGEIRG